MGGRTAPFRKLLAMLDADVPGTLRQLRSLLGVTLAQMDNLIGLTYGSVAHCEHGKLTGARKSKSFAKIKLYLENTGCIFSMRLVIGSSLASSLNVITTPFIALLLRAINTTRLQFSIMLLWNALFASFTYTRWAFITFSERLTADGRALIPTLNL